MTTTAVSPISALAAAKPAAPADAHDPHDAKIRAVSKEFEATFLAQALSFAGLGKAVSTDSGYGGEAFSSLLVEQYASKIAEGGGIGVAETIYQELKAREAAHDTRA